MNNECKSVNRGMSCEREAVPNKYNRCNTCYDRFHKCLTVQNETFSVEKRDAVLKRKTIKIVTKSFYHPNLINRSFVLQSSEVAVHSTKFRYLAFQSCTSEL